MSISVDWWVEYFGGKSVLPEVQAAAIARDMTARPHFLPARPERAGVYVI